VGKWFIKKRGIAIEISTMGVSFGTIALTPLLFMGRINPESYGLLPDGDRRTAKAPEADHVVKHPSHLLE
jgi:hypothetical protein